MKFLTPVEPERLDKAEADKEEGGTTDAAAGKEVDQRGSSGSDSR